MNILHLKQHLRDNEDDLRLLLDYIGVHRISSHGKELRGAIDEDSNPTSIKVNKETLGYSDFGRNKFGDIITLVQDLQGVEFTDALKLISSVLGFDINYKPQPKYQLFGGFFDNIKVIQGEIEVELEVFNEDILDRYDKCANRRFLEDGISITTQQKFKIGYDEESCRITIPWRNYTGGIIGIMGRYNGENYKEDGIAKYLPVVPFSKKQVLYGYSENYKMIIEKGHCFMGEGEKFTMQLFDMSLPAMSLGGNRISDIQVKYIHSLGIKKLILCLDEGLDEEHIIEQAKKLTQSMVFNNMKVGYVFDRNNKYLEKGSKSSPSDKGKETLEKLVRECTVWIN